MKVILHGPAEELTRRAAVAAYVLKNCSRPSDNITVIASVDADLNDIHYWVRWGKDSITVRKTDE